MATDMPEDIQTPNEPNGVDQSKVPSVVGVTSPIDYTKEDPWGTLPPGAIKYEIDSTKWTAVPINQGVYKIVSRNEGQAIYVAEDAQGSQSLRITKSFNIETTGRTALYLKGQSDLDILVEQVVNLLATKADKESVYTKEETDQQIQNAINGAIGGLTSILTYKGTVANEAALANIQNPAQGDTYQAEDTGLFYSWIAEPAPGSWEKLSGSIVDLSNYYTKGQIDLALTGKADQADLEALEQKVDLLLLQNKPFTYIQSTDPAAVDPDPTKAGEIWFDNSTGLIYIRKTSQIDQTLYWLNSIDNALLGLDTKYMKLEGDQTASGVKTFTGNIKLTTPPASDEDVVNKQYVDESIANAGMGSANFVTLDATEQSIDGHKTFIGEISVPEPQNGTDAATKKYVDDKFQDATTTLPLNVVLTDSDQTISSIKTFENGKNPKYNTHPADFTDLELVDKKYVDDAIAGGITLPLNLAYLDRANTFTATNNFTGVTNLYGGGSSYVDPVNDTDIANKKYVDNAIQQSGGGVDLSNLVTLNTEQTITGKKLFSKIQSTQAVIEDNDLTSKAYVDKAIADLGDTITLDGYAKLAEANTFTALNTFDVLPQSTATPTDPKDLVTKQYNDDRLTGVENNINTKIGDLNNLSTTDKSSIVAAINEVKDTGGGGVPAGNYVTIDTKQTITAAKSFDILPTSKDYPSSPDSLVNRSYVLDLVQPLLPNSDWQEINLTMTLSGDRYGGGCLSDLNLLIDRPLGATPIDDERFKYLWALNFTWPANDGQLGVSNGGVSILVTWEELERLTGFTTIEETRASTGLLTTEYQTGFLTQGSNFNLEDIKNWCNEKGINNYVILITSASNVYGNSTWRYTYNTHARWYNQTGYIGAGSPPTFTARFIKVGNLSFGVYDITYSPNVYNNSLDYNTTTTLTKFTYTKLSGVEVNVIDSSKPLKTGNTYFNKMGETDLVFNSPLIEAKEVSSGGNGTNIISTTDPSGKDYEEGTLWINTSYIEDVGSPGSFLQIPEIWIRVKDGWWGLHREGLIKDV